MDLLKVVFITAPALVSFDYTEKAGLVILAADSSLTGWRAVLMRKINKKGHLSRYESGT